LFLNRRVFRDGEVFGFQVVFLLDRGKVVVVLGIIKILGVAPIFGPFLVLQWLFGDFRVAEVFRGVVFPGACNGFPSLVCLRSFALFLAP
jgi:hypothetical protein